MGRFAFFIAQVQQKSGPPPNHPVWPETVVGCEQHTVYGPSSKRFLVFAQKQNWVILPS